MPMNISGPPWVVDIPATPIQALVSGAWNVPQRVVGYENEQPANITRPVTLFGKMAARFGSGHWTATAGAPTLTQGYTGWDGSGNKTGVVSRTGQPDMLKAVPAANTTETIRLQTFGTNMLTPLLSGKFGLWVYVEAQPGYQVGGTPAGSITVELSTNAATMGNSLAVAFGASQVREGWNYLTFVMRNTAAYVSGSGQTEYHPFGISPSGYGTGADANIKDTAVARAQISWSNMLGATLYFDSLWTGFAAQGQLVFGCDGGAGFSSIAKALFDQYGYVGYVALPYGTQDTGTSTTTVQANLMSNGLADAAVAYAAGWDVINHTVTHPSLGGMSSEASIAYQVDHAKAWLIEMGYIRGSEFYASPASSTSRLSESVIKRLGYRVQRHARRWCMPVTPFGIDNPHHIGAIDMGHSTTTGVSLVTAGTSGSTAGWQKFSKIQRAIDIAEAYGETANLFWHGVTTTGDNGTGEDATGDDLLMTRSALSMTLDYVRQRAAAGGLRVCRGMSDFWYGGSAQ